MSSLRQTGLQQDSECWHSGGDDGLQYFDGPNLAGDIDSTPWAPSEHTFGRVELYSMLEEDIEELEAYNAAIEFGMHEPPALIMARSPSLCSSTDSPESGSDVCDEPPVVRTESKHACRICQSSYDNVYMLEDHARSLKHRIFDCGLPGCDRSYCRRDLLTRHRKTHESVHVCQMCQEKDLVKTFKRRDHLRQHYRNCHSGALLPPTTTRALDASERLRDGSIIKPRCSCARVADRNGRYLSMSTVEGQHTDAMYNSSHGYRSSIVQDIVAELSEPHGCSSNDIRSVRESLDLKKSSTSGDLIRSMTQLVQHSPRTIAVSPTATEQSGSDDCIESKKTSHSLR